MRTEDSAASAKGRRAAWQEQRLLRASELGEYEFCARSWWLGRVLGRERENVEELAAGRQRHSRHGRQVGLAHLLQRAALLLILVAIVLTIALALIGGAR